MKKIVVSILFICLFAHLPFSTFAQDSSRLRISLLTCTPGEELYSTFGHSAIRIVYDSPAAGVYGDVVYNFGTFDYGDPAFYQKFVKGRLLYYVSASTFEEFKYDYQSTNRGITEQVLNLTAVEKIAIQQLLTEFIKEENKYYKYDFFFDNCTTRLRDILKKQHDSTFTRVAVMQQGSSFRQAIHQYLNRKNKDWTKLGMDLLLGKPSDAVMTAEQMQFLPDNLMKSLDSSKHNDVLTSQNLYKITDEENSKSYFTPFVIFSILFVGIFFIGRLKNKFAHAFLQGFDGLLFFITGALGAVLIFLWTGTDHLMFGANYNLIWAWPTHMILAFFVNSKKNWVKKYFKFTAVALMAVLISWYFLPQQMNDGLLPLVCLLIYRSVKKSLATMV